MNDAKKTVELMPNWGKVSRVEEKLGLTKMEIVLVIMSGNIILILYILSTVQLSSVFT